MSQILVIQVEFFNSLSKPDNLKIISDKGFADPTIFINSIISKLNDEFAFLEIRKFRFAIKKNERSQYSQYAAFVESDDDLPYKKIVVFFTPINSKLGNVIIEQSLMPTICKQMEQDITFLLNDNFKKIAVLTSWINKENQVNNAYNTLQMNINSLNTMNFDVVPFFPIKNLSTDTKFNSLTEYKEMTDFLQKKVLANTQFNYFNVKDNILIGNCNYPQLQGEFIKSYCFRYLTAMMSGGNEYKYSIAPILSNLKEHNRSLDNQFSNLQNFINFVNANVIKQMHFIVPIDDDVIESDDDIANINDINRMPEKGIDGNGRKRFKTQKKVRDNVLQAAGYICDCDDDKHFYFGGVDLNNYVEGHHIVPMNRQEEYYYSNQINLDIPYNIIPLCPNCHCQIHLGSRQARLKIISEIFVRHKANLLAFDTNLTLRLLASYYNIGLEEEEEKDWIRRATSIITRKKL